MADLERFSDEQLATISKACEILARLYMGQLEEVARLFDRLPDEQRQELTEKLIALKPLITQLSARQHLSINNDIVPDIARNAFDIHKTIQHYWQQKSHLT